MTDIRNRPQTEDEKEVQESITKIMTDLQEWMDEHFVDLQIPSKVALMGAFSELSQNTTEHVVKLLLSLDKEIKEDNDKLSDEDFAKVKAYAESLHRKKQGKKEN
jgi:epoxyqueuosine reductase QueG